MPHAVRRWWAAGPAYMTNGTQMQLRRPASHQTISSRMLRALLVSAMGTSNPTSPHLAQHTEEPSDQVSRAGRAAKTRLLTLHFSHCCAHQCSCTPIAPAKAQDHSEQCLSQVSDSTVTLDLQTHAKQRGARLPCFALGRPAPDHDLLFAGHRRGLADSGHKRLPPRL